MQSLISLIVIIWLEMKQQQQQEIIQEQIGEAFDEHISVSIWVGIDQPHRSIRMSS